MTQRPNRGRRRGNGKGPARPAAPAPAATDRYTKYLPAWMKAADGSVNPPPRPRGPRRARQPRPAGGYTPGKFAQDDVLR